jgi:uncharacterized protein (DUF488 family)
VTLWTIGHSSRTLEEFLALLARYEIQAIADVRRFPGSRKQPWFGREPLEASLATSGYAYRWIPALGGRRRPKADSPNSAWRNESFRGYADHMASDEFARGLDELLELAARMRTSLMCAELVWWRCHRALISDVLSARGMEVLHILDEKQLRAHRYTPPARIVDGALTYAAAGAEG